MLPKKIKTHITLQLFMKSSNQVKAISFFLVSLFIVLTFFVLSVNAAQVNWTIETVDAGAYVGVDTCIAVDSLNKPRISYFDEYWRNLKYAHWTGSAWSVEAGSTTTLDAMLEYYVYLLQLQVQGSGSQLLVT